MKAGATAKDVILTVIRYVAANGQRESPLLTNRPQFEVNADGLFIHLEEKFEVSREEINGWLEEE